MADPPRTDPTLTADKGTADRLGASPSSGRRLILMDANVLEQINRGNEQAARRLRTLLSTDDVYLSKQGHRENVIEPAIRRTAVAKQLLMDELHIPIRQDGGNFALRKEVIDRNYTAPRSGNPILQPKDLLTAAQARALNAEVWSFDTVYRTNYRAVEKTLGVRVAPESYSIPLAIGEEDYRVGRQLLGLEPVNISLSGVVTRPGPRPPGGGTGGPPSPAGGGAAPAPAARATDRPPGGAPSRASRTTEPGLDPSAGSVPGAEPASTPAPRPTPQAPAGAGAARGAGALTIALVLMEFAAIYADYYIQGKEAKAADEDLKRQVSSFLQGHPEFGALIVITFKQQVRNPSGEASLHAPGPKFCSVMAYYGTTYAEARTAWRVSNDADDLDQRYFAESYDMRWIPPRMPGAGRNAGSNPLTTAALVRDLQTNLKPPSNYGSAFHKLNGCAMKQMLQALNALKQAGQLDLLIENFEKAQGVNRGRLWVALKATYFRGSDSAYQLFMADPTCSYEMTSVEPEGQSAIKRVLLRNQGD